MSNTDTKVPEKTIAERSLNTAFVILKGKRHVANVQFKYPKDGAGRLEVEVWSNSTDKDPRFQRATAGGYGYDKATASLRGLTIDGHKLSDHCGVRREPPKATGVFPEGSKAPRGWRFANYRVGEGSGSEQRPSGYTSCHRESGFAYLKALGYSVIQAL